MVEAASSRLTIVAARITRKLPAVQDFGTRRPHIELSMQTPVVELPLLLIGDASPGIRGWARPGYAAPPSSTRPLELAARRDSRVTSKAFANDGLLTAEPSPVGVRHPRAFVLGE
jgi:hypothetical protein